MKRILIIILVLWSVVFVVDHVTIFVFHDRPIFARKHSASSYDDGGSGTYIGLGNSYTIKGNFMPDSDYDLDGVVQAESYLLGFKLFEIKRGEWY